MKKKLFFIAEHCNMDHRKEKGIDFMEWMYYQKLIVWQKAMELAEEIYKLTKSFPKDELYSLCNQLRRAAVSIPSNIAEGQGRQTIKEKKHFFSISRGSTFEVETQLLLSVRIGYLQEETAQKAFQLCDEIGRMIHKLIQNLKEDEA